MPLHRSAARCSNKTFPGPAGRSNSVGLIEHQEPASFAGPCVDTDAGRIGRLCRLGLSPASYLDTRVTRATTRVLS